VGTAQSHSSEELVVEEIRRMVAEAVSNGGIISTAGCVAQIKALYPTSGFSRRHIADEVMMAAAAAGLAVEIGPVMREVQKRRTQASDGVSEEVRAALREHLRARLGALRDRIAGSTPPNRSSELSALTVRKLEIAPQTNREAEAAE